MLQAACFDLISDLRNLNLHNQYNTGLIKPEPETKELNDVLIIDNSSSPDSPFVAIDDSIFSLSDSLGLSGLLDSTSILATGKDSSKNKVKINQDSLRLVQMALDSTARLQYFRYQREDLPYTTLQQKKKSKFFIEPSATYKTRTITIDSTGKFVEIKEIIAGKPSKIILKVPIEEYIETRLQVEERKKWEALGYAYELKNSQLGLGDLIKNFTDFEIPLPSVGVLSIFGAPKISLKIGGSVQIHGAWRSETTEGVTASRLGNTRNEPDFKQQVQINVNGTIGDKLNIVADWNTERTFEYENQLKIKYTGYEDEIIQSIEAGNVSLQTSPLVGGSEALFGIKAQMKMGPFSLTTIASQKKGETKEVQVSGGSSEVPFQKRAYEYSTNHYFIDTVYASKTSKVFYNYYGNPTPQVNSSLLVTDIQVWKSVIQYTLDNSKERFANAYINLDPNSVGQLLYPDNLRSDTVSTVGGQIYSGRFTLLTPDVDYILHAETGFITFKTAINDKDAIAIAYRQEQGVGSSNDDFFYGEFLAAGDTNTTRRLVLKLVKPENLQPGGDFTTAWSLMLKNIYALGPRNIKQEGFEFDIKREIEGQEPTSEIGTTRLLKAFGLDLLNSSSQAQSDNIFDYRPGITIIPETGEVVFPNLEPFSDDLPADLAYDTYNFDEVYDTTKNFAGQKKIKDKWILVGKSKGSSSSIYQLGFNVVENSVKVLLNGRELSAGSDYIVDYNIGQLTIRNDAALVPGADLKITYEQNDLFQLASKTLLGARGIYEFSKKTKLGFSILNLNQQTLSDKVRIGEEPLSNSIYGLDFSTSADLPFVTKLLDNVFSTREMSSFNLSAEYAYIDPDPNTKKSTILSDGGKSIAYIDDFEGAKKTIPIGISYTSWKDISPPDSLYLLYELNKDEKMHYKGKSFWFTETPAQVTVEDIYFDKKQVARADQQITVMDYVFLPDTPGTYNYLPTLQERNKNWGGIQKILSSTASNLIEENIDYVEFWAQIIDAPSNAKLYIDIGKVSEDVIPNNKLDTEDKDRNDAIDSDGNEDTGLDGILDDVERSENGSTKSDPSGDNFFFQRSNPQNLFDYFSINGTQGNAILTDVGRLPDTEDLNRNGNLDKYDSYFRYEVALDTNFSTNEFLADGGFNPRLTNKWYLFRVPLKDYATTVGSPSFSDVETIRLFIQGVDSMVHFRITEFNLVGNQWQKNLPDSIARTDTILSVSVASLEENSDYSSPPGVFQERDRTRPDENILRNEQSLSLILNGLEDGDKREAVKYLYRPLDVFNYKQMKLFIHGDQDNRPGRISYADTSGGVFQHSSEVYFRFGGDTNNYYEYRQPVFPGWNEVTFNFDELTALKQARGDNDTSAYFQAVVGAPTGHFYVIKGNPTLTTVKFLSVGIVNLDNGFNTGPLSGEVWVNELRVVGADDSPGWAYSLSTSLKLADFATVSFNLSEKNPYFHRLSDRFGSRVEQRNWSVSTDVNLLKILPVNLPESNLRLNYSHTESIGKPLYLPGSDVRVDNAVENQQALYDSNKTVKSPEQLREETETESISDSWSASNIKLKIPTKFWLIRDTFNAITMGFNYNKAFSRGPTVLSNRSWVWNANLNYGLSLSPEYYFNPIDIPVIGVLFALLKDYSGTKVYFTPQNFSLALTAKRNSSTNITRERKNSPSSQVSSRDFTTSRGFNFAWKLTEGGFLNLTTSYALNISSSLAYLETYNDSAATPRLESEIWSEIFNGAFFGRDNRYQQNFDIRTAPKLPSLFDINKYFTLTASYGASYQWTNDFRQEIVGRSAGFSNKSTVGLTMRWKSLFDPLFKDDVNKDNQQKNNFIGNKGVLLNKEPKETEYDSLGNVISVVDSVALMDSLLILENKPSMVSRAVSFLVAAAKYVFLDYEMISFNFSNDNTLSKSGLKAQGTGFRNFWGIFYDDDAGPTRGFMLGLSSDAGPRVGSAGTNLSDVYSQKNNIDFKTSRPLWEGAKIDISWKTGWSVNKNSTINVEDDGSVFVTNVNSTGTLNRSFLTIPPVLFLSAFKSGIKQVAELYNPQDPNSNLSKAFVKGFESLPIFANFGFLEDYANYIPRPNWRITWDGLEKLPFLRSLADRISLDHSYSSSYTEGWKLSREGNEEVQVQKIEYGFAPLLGLNLTFGQLWGGNFTGNLKYSTRTSFDLGITTSNITENFSKDIGFTLQFSKSGFELPLFGVALKNDIEFSLAYTSSRSAAVRYEMSKIPFNEEGIPQDGTTRVTIEPRIKYTISAKVTLSVFYKRSTVEPEGASRIPPTTSNEAGLDVSISIN
ncbi:MAG: cell surface protein SprA [Ignavibacteriales bacterium]|nr:cell surface protein SprA [Ignavibacteriales bacterium]